MTSVTVEVGGAWMPPEDFVATTCKISDPKKRKAVLRRVREMTQPKGRTRETFDPRHIKRLSEHMVLLYVTKPNAAGKSAPEIVPRKK